MPTAFAPAVYRCSVPAFEGGERNEDQGNTHRPAGLKGCPHPFPAWPEIPTRGQLVCFPALYRAVYYYWEPARRDEDREVLALEYLEAHESELISRLGETAVSQARQYLQDPELTNT